MNGHDFFWRLSLSVFMSPCWSPILRCGRLGERQNSHETRSKTGLKQEVPRNSDILLERLNCDCLLKSHEPHKTINQISDVCRTPYEN